ncbi:hypothetical protein M408DRAFT_270199 [Serendipita vermifera MAFF 305830]|uniref:FAD-binding domain-containing protein n=1 Tax=Serendipita vermifera MAFF 305830 TaxID=933852 RepID=A0A0C3BH37_SERVB|nr:hypothetical protein M408DRAFT_270199 [Serendipita vermifera MAFF 305830]
MASKDSIAPDPPILIIGAGITGLLIAQALKQTGIRYIIFEREPSASHYRQREWGMSIHWSRPLLEELLPTGIHSRLREAQTDPSMDMSGKGDGQVEGGGYMVPFYNGQTGVFMKEMPMKNSIRVSRRKMRALCAEGIQIEYGKNISRIETSSDETTVVAYFEDGSTYRGSTLIGADGAKSKVRELIMGAEDAKPSSVDIVLYNVNVCYGDAQKAKAIRAVHPVNHVALHPGEGISVWTSIQDVPSPDEPETWKFQIMPSWKGTRDETMDDAARLSKLKEIAETLAEPWKSELKWIPDGTPVADNAVSYWKTTQWNNMGGRVTLAGDAAHPMPPHRGQGLNHCISDAMNLVTALKSVYGPSSSPVSLKVAILDYDTEVVKRGSEEVETSLKSAILIHQKMTEAPVLNQGYAKG